MSQAPVSYEVTVRLPTEAEGERFSTWMRMTHIPAVMATSCFRSAELARLEPAAFRTRYLAASAADLDRYLSVHAAGLRDDFAREFGATAKVSREHWEVLAAWP